LAIDSRLTKARKAGFGAGLLKGMAVTLKHLFKHNTVIQYPDEKQDLSPRTRGVIALKEENCTVCMLCGRECPDWCIYIDSHKETLPPKREGGRPRKRNVLDRFAIDYALCMYCGICVEVCPYDALFWSREFEYAEYDIRELTHEKERLSDWMDTVLPPPELERGAELPGQPAAAAGAAGPGTAQRPSPPAQRTASEERPQQAARAPESASAPAPAPSQATEAQKQAGETQPAEAGAAPTEQKAEAPAPTTEIGAAGEQPEAVKAEAEKAPPPEAAGPPAEAPVQEPTPTEPTAATGAGATVARPSVSKEELDRVYEQVLKEQLEAGSSPQVAEARAKVARVKAERGIGREGPKT
jgi:formate hydrogenlyase subunit 6/NADH:ubiquinone oxidoreductase subunit I